MASTAVHTRAAEDGGGHRPCPVDDHRTELRGRLGGDDLGHEPEPRGHHPAGDPGHAEGGRPQPGRRLRHRPGLRAGVVRRRAGQARPVRARDRGLARQRGDQRRRALDRLCRESRDRPADHDERVDGPARAEGRGGRRGRDVRDLRRHPGDEEQPDRRDGRARLPRLELEVEGRPAGRLHPRLPGAARQHDRDAAVPGAAPGRAGAGAGARRGAAAEVAVRAHRARELQPRRLRRAGRVRDRVRLRSPLPGQARLQGAGGQVQRAGPRLGQRDRRLPERGRHLHGVHDAGLPRQVHAVHGRGQVGCGCAADHRSSPTARSSATCASATSRRSTTSSPSGAGAGTTLTTGYAKRW